MRNANARDPVPNSSGYSHNVSQWNTILNTAYFEDAMNEFMGTFSSDKFPPELIISQTVCQCPATDAVLDNRPKRI